MKYVQTLAVPDEQAVFSTKIAGVLIQPLKIINTAGGPVLHLLRKSFALFPEFAEDFGEIYFSEILPNCVKAWKKHTLQTQLFAVPAGLIRLVLYDGRQNSPTNGKLEKLLLGRPDNYELVQIPPGIWYGFQCLSSQPAMICNCANLPHNPLEGQTMPQDWTGVPHNWAS